MASIIKTQIHESMELNNDVEGLMALVRSQSWLVSHQALQGWLTENEYWAELIELCSISTDVDLQAAVNAIANMSFQGLYVPRLVGAITVLIELARSVQTNECDLMVQLVIQSMSDELDDNWQASTPQGKQYYAFLNERPGADVSQAQDFMEGLCRDLGKEFFDRECAFHGYALHDLCSRVHVASFSRSWPVVLQYGTALACADFINRALNSDLDITGAICDVLSAIFLGNLSSQTGQRWQSYKEFFDHLDEEVLASPRLEGARLVQALLALDDQYQSLGIPSDAWILDLALIDHQALADALIAGFLEKGRTDRAFTLTRTSVERSPGRRQELIERLLDWIIDAGGCRKLTYAYQSNNYEWLVKCSSRRYGLSSGLRSKIDLALEMSHSLDQGWQSEASKT